MIEKAVEKLVDAIAKEEAREAVRKRVDEKIEALVTAQINKVLEKGIAGAIEKTLTAKLSPILKQIEKIDVTSVVDKVSKISLGDEIDTMVDELSSTIKSKIIDGIQKAKLIEVDVSGVNDKANAIIGDQIEDILDDDEEVEKIVTEGVREVVRDKFKLKQPTE